MLAIGRKIVHSLGRTYPREGAITVERLCFKISTREIRAIKILKRRELPKYKRDLRDLPPLTDHLVSQNRYLDRGQEGLQILWAKKLEVYKAYLPMDSGVKPVLLEAMYNPKNDIDSTLRIIHDNLETMTSFYVANCFEILDDQMNFNPDYLGTVSVSPEFKSLCKKALFKMRFLEADEILKVIKCLATLGIPEDTVIVQSALQMARHLINDFDSGELDALAASLESFVILENSRHSLLSVLKAAIPVAKENLMGGKVTATKQLDTKKEVEEPRYQH